MHVMYVHQNYPAQFGHIGRALARMDGYRVTFVSQKSGDDGSGMRRIPYQVAGGATSHTHYSARTFENAVWHASGVYDALKPLADEVRPDLIVGHSGFGSTLFLPELFPDTPILNYFEYFYHPTGTDMDFRTEWATAEEDKLRSRARNGMILLDLENCAAGYTPTCFQHALFPESYRAKLRVIHDGIDTSFWRPGRAGPRRLGSQTIPAETPLVTYVSRGFEAMRGFDIFMRTAKRIYERNGDVRFLVIGADEAAYGGDKKRISAPSFRHHVLAEDDYDLSRFLFLGQVSPASLARILGWSDLHIYLTVPFVLSWSLLNAMACGCTVLASDTAPLHEVIDDGENGYLREFYDVDGLAETGLEVLAAPAAHRESLGRAARRTVAQRYSLNCVLPQMLELYGQTVTAGPG